MSKIAITGVLCWVGGFLILLFQAISSVMGMDAEYENFALVDAFPPELVEAIGNMEEGLILSATDYITTMPVYIILFVVGAALLILSSFLWRK